MERTNVRCLNHADIVPSIANAADPFLGMVADQAGDIGLLGGRAAAGHDRRQLRGNLDKLISEHIQT